MIILQEDLLERNRPVSQLSHGAAVRRREKIYDVVILDPISGLRCSSNGATGAFASGTRGRAGTGTGAGMCTRDRTHTRVHTDVRNF